MRTLFPYTTLFRSEVGEDNHSESPGVVRRGAMAPHWPSNRVYLFPVTSEVLRPGRIWYTLPNWQWVVPTRQLTKSHECP